ncbi:hypothetical protein ACSBR2_008508 [Camellia fascicularis]
MVGVRNNKVTQNTSAVYFPEWIYNHRDAWIVKKKRKKKKNYCQTVVYTLVSCGPTTDESCGANVGRRCT